MMALPMSSTGALSLLALAAVLGAPIDGKRDVVCQPTHIAQCEGAALCASVDLADIDLPPELHVSFADKKLFSPQTDRSSPIHSVDMDEAVVVVQGSQNGRGWSMVIDRASGALNGTIADAEGAFVVAGTCAPR
jgi:hypothetical protein